MFPLFQLRLQHGFFNDQQWLNAELLADQATQELIQRYQWQLIQQRNVWSLYSHAMTGRETFLSHLAGFLDGQSLRFWILQPLPNFITFTDLPLDWQGLLSFSTQTALPSKDNQLPHLPFTTSPFGAAPEHAVGVIDLYINDLLTQPSYQIQLHTRKTYWEYRLIQRHQVRLQQPEILNHHGERVFSKPEKYVTDAGETAWRVSSGQQQLPMQQVPNTMLKLVDNQLVDVHAGRSVQRTVLNALPTPRTDQIQPHTEQPTQALSVVYVYL